MRIYTAHVRPERAPELVREGFSWGALAFGPLWLLAHRAWIPAAIYVAVVVAAIAVAPPTVGAAIGWAVVLLSGVLGSDLVRWSLERRGYALAGAVAAPDADYAFARLLAHRPELREPDLREVAA